MDKTERISIKSIIRETKDSSFVLNCEMPMGYTDGLPILHIGTGCLYLVIPFLKYQTTGEVDKTLVFPIRYLIRVKLPQGKITGFTDLSGEPGFERLDFTKPVGVFRHEAIKQYNKAQYTEERNRLLDLYEKAVNARLFGGEFSKEEEHRMGGLLRILTEPSLKPMYRRLDKEFYDTYLAMPAGDADAVDTVDTVDSVDGVDALSDLSPMKGRLPLILEESVKELADSGQERLAEDLKRIHQEGKRDQFAVAVVGEFSRGKSTFLNKLLEKELLPVGDMPTTALLTSIRYGRTEMLTTFDKHGKKQKMLPLSEESWEGLTAENYGKADPIGRAVVTADIPWLAKHNIELMDTPGAGDLEEARARVIGDALLGCDGVMITVSALAALSLSEKIFIEERLLSRKSPFLVILVTKLDLVPKEQRAGIIDYIKSRLKLWNMEIPVLIPYTVEMPDDRYDGIMGMDQVKELLISWTKDPQRLRLAEYWTAARMLDAVNMAVASKKEQRLLLEADEEERKRLLGEKKQKLSKAEIAWEDLRLKLLERGNECYAQMLKKAEEYKKTITERLQYEAAHTNNPEKWWTEDYPYRLKVELTNMSAGIEAAISHIIMEDAGWFNSALDRQFRTQVLVKKGMITEKETFEHISITKMPHFENMDKQRALVRVGTAALSIAGYVVCSSIGFLPIIATMGIGTGTAVISEKVFKQKAEKQRESLKEAIAKNVPELIDSAMCESEARLKALYDDILTEAVKKENVWMEEQKVMIENSTKAKKSGEKEMIDRQMACLNDVLRKLNQV